MPGDGNPCHHEDPPEIGEPEKEPQESELRPSDQQEEVDQQTNRPGQASTEIPTSQETLNPELCPIGRVIEGDQSEVTPIDMAIHAQPNIMKEQEKLHMAQLESQFGYTQRPDYCRGSARHIYRCSVPKCGLLLNPNGLERSIRGHFKKYP